MKIVEVTCRYGNQAFNVRHGGQSASSTSSSETAVHRLAEKLWGKKVKTITLLGHGDDLYSDRWRVEVDEPAQSGTARIGSSSAMEGAHS